MSSTETDSRGTLLQRLAAAVCDELEARGLVGEGDDIVPVAKYAHEKGIDRSTVYRQAKRKGVPIRDETGAIKENGGVACVSRLEMEMEEELSMRSVRRADGQYD